MDETGKTEEAGDYAEAMRQFVAGPGTAPADAKALAKELTAMVNARADALGADRKWFCQMVGTHLIETTLNKETREPVAHLVWRELTIHLAKK